MKFYEPSIESMRAAAAAYLAATALSTLAAYFCMPTRISDPRISKQSPASLSTTSSANYRDIKKIIETRNLFNPTGELPEESSLEAVASAKFDLSAPCVKTTLPVQLVGIIAGGPTRSVAVLRQKGVNESDYYKAGDVLIDHETARIVTVDENMVVLNNNGRKECLESLVGETLQRSGQTAPAGDQVKQACADVEVDESYVLEQLGPDSVNILNVGRLVPQIDPLTGKGKGFKLIDVKADSLYRKICLQEGDIITQVNSTSMEQSDQGFALYQALQDDKDIRLGIIRDGEPMAISIKVKSK